MRKAVLIFGAGASLDFGAPSTAGMRDCILTYLEKDDYSKHKNLKDLYTSIESDLTEYFGTHGTPNFEQIYHVAHELVEMKPPEEGFALEFRPVLLPFLEVNNLIDFERLRQLAKKIIEAIYHQVGDSSRNPSVSLDPISVFFDSLRKDFICRTYTTNYDSFLDQSCDNYYTGFTDEVDEGVRVFDRENFFDQTEHDCLFHLHGSVHFGYPHNDGFNIGELGWFDDPTKALKHSSFDGSEVRRMDGTQIMRTPVLTGLDKLGRLQEKPLSFYHSQMNKDLMSADLILMVGCGLTDLHINSWVAEARSRTGFPPLIFVDYWEGGLRSFLHINKIGRKEITMLNELRVAGMMEYGTEDFKLSEETLGWTINKKYKSAIYDRGFTSFLHDSLSFNDVLQCIDRTNRT